MQNLFGSSDQTLPEVLQDDLEELLTWDNNAYLTWMSVNSEAENACWFTVKLSSNGRDFGLRLEFWIPEWMTARGAAAVLPANWSLSECKNGERAVVDLGMGKWSAMVAALPRISRTCARLMNELWGETDVDDVMLMTIDYQDDQLEVPFTEIAGYGR
jgi:hypothetical protein